MHVRLVLRETWHLASTYYEVVELNEGKTKVAQVVPLKPPPCSM